MKSADLHTVWGAPDNSRLTAKQQSFRLPTDVAAQLEALCELFPNKTKTEIVGDLLRAAIDELAPNLPKHRGQVVTIHPEGGKIYAAHGPAADFRQLANKHYKEFERELGNKKAGDLYSGEFIIAENELE